MQKATESSETERTKKRTHEACRKEHRSSMTVSAVPKQQTGRGRTAVRPLLMAAGCCWILECAQLCKAIKSRGL
eukprot:4374509-Pleurochrysis_carterae.AAC.3